MSSRSLPPLFSTVKDSPQFRKQVETVGESVDDLEARLTRVHRASLKYRDALQTLCATQSEFGTSLLECRCPGTDENAIKGNEQLTRLAGYLHELSGLNDVLYTNHENLLCESIDRFWLRGSIQNCKESKRHMAHATAQYDAASKRYLGAGKTGGRRGDRHDRARVDMQQAEAVAQEARFACVRRLLEVEGQRRYTFLESTEQTLAAHLRNAHRSWECMKRAEGLLADTRAQVSVMKDEEQGQYNKLESLISDLVSQQASRARQSTAHRASELSGNMIRTSDRVAADVRSTAEGEGVKVLKEGFLLKRSQKGMVRTWDRRFFTLNSQGLLFYQSAKAKADSSGRAQGRQLNVMNTTVLPGCEDVSRQHAFTVACSEAMPGERMNMFELQAEGPAEQQDWMTIIQAVILTFREDNMPHHPTHRTAPARDNPQFTADAFTSAHVEALYGVARHPTPTRQPAFPKQADGQGRFPTPTRQPAFPSPLARRGSMSQAPARASGLSDTSASSSASAAALPRQSSQAINGRVLQRQPAADEQAAQAEPDVQVQNDSAASTSDADADQPAEVDDPTNPFSRAWMNAMGPSPFAAEDPADSDPPRAPQRSGPSRPDMDRDTTPPRSPWDPSEPGSQPGSSGGGNINPFTPFSTFTPAGPAFSGVPSSPRLGSAAAPTNGATVWGPTRRDSGSQTPSSGSGGLAEGPGSPAAQGSRQHHRNPSWDTDAVPYKAPRRQPMSRPPEARTPLQQQSQNQQPPRSGFWSSLLAPKQQQQQHQQPATQPLTQWQHQQQQRQQQLQEVRLPPPPRMPSPKLVAQHAGPSEGMGAHSRTQSNPALPDMTGPPDAGRAVVNPLTKISVSSARSEPMAASARALSPPPRARQFASPMRQATEAQTRKAGAPPRTRPAGAQAPGDHTLADLERRLQALMQ
ncbi:hypothetical protein WJX73_002804 [Symbiochloris irregularis]|uniref:PH domain-containing protein n=1 Tax=Symbiochloris irregularis TaxID=706552 RepID=A0AAW1P0Z2_9CHLO